MSAWVLIALKLGSGDMVESVAYEELDRAFTCRVTPTNGLHPSSPSHPNHSLRSHIDVQ